MIAKDAKASQQIKLLAHFMPETGVRYGNLSGASLSLGSHPMREML